MDRADVSEADLLRAIAVLPAAQIDLAAEAIGFRRLHTVKDEGQARQEPRRPALRKPPEKPTPAEPASAAPAHEAPFFWRVASDMPSAPDLAAAPAWLATQQPIDDASVETSAVTGVAPQPLSSAHRFATFIRRHLAVAMRSAEPDTHVAVQRIARGEALTDCPALMRHRWPGGVHLVVDASTHLWPLAFDLGLLARELERLLGQRLRLFRSPGSPAVVQDADMRPASLPADGAPVIVLGDAALLLQDSRRQQTWADWGLRQQQAGRRVLLLAPVPATLVTRQLAEAFDVVPLGQAGGLRLMAGGADAAAEAASGQARELAPATALLRDLLFGNSYVEPALLRRLGRSLQSHGHAVDVAAEAAVWRHSSVVSDPGGCTLHPDQRDAARQSLLAMERDLLIDALSTHWEFLQAASPLVRAEFCQWWAGLLQQRRETGPWLQVLARGMTEGETLMRGAAAGLWKQPGQATDGLAAYLRRFGGRSPDLLGASEGHQLAWTMAQRQALAAGAVPLPGAVELAKVGWILGNDSDNKAMRLALQGEAESVGSGRVRLQWMDDASQPASVLADGVALGRLWSVEFEPVARQRTLRWMRALIQTVANPGPAKPTAAQARLEKWLWSAARAAGGLGPPEATQDDLARDKERAKPLPDARGMRPGMSRERVAQLVGTHRQLAQLLSQGQLPDLLLERLALELWAWLGAYRRGPASGSGPDELQTLLAAVLSDSALAAMRRAAAVPPPRQHLRREAALVLQPQHACSLLLPGRTLVLDAVQRPAWADAIWRDNDRLMAEVADGPKLCWCPASTLRLVDAADGEGDQYTLAAGCWWDARECNDFLGSDARTLTRPSWAIRHGVDAYGYWAEFALPATVSRPDDPTQQASRAGASIGQRMRFIPPGRFWMGSPMAEAGRHDGETLHPVTLTRGYWLADTACTQSFWQAVTGELPEGQPATGADLPVVGISHDDITQRFLPALERHLPEFGGRLPSEAEWEYAARAGTTSAYPWGEEPDPRRMRSHSDERSREAGPLPVDALVPNAWGLRQMHGNVWEWCADALADYPVEETLDPLAQGEARRVVRGGSWYDNARYCRSARRDAIDPDTRYDGDGFRLARGLPEAGRAEPAGRGAPGLPAEPAGDLEPRAGNRGDSVRPSLVAAAKKRRK